MLFYSHDEVYWLLGSDEDVDVASYRNRDEHLLHGANLCRTQARDPRRVNVLQLVNSPAMAVIGCRTIKAEIVANGTLSLRDPPWWVACVALPLDMRQWAYLNSIIGS